MLILSRRIGQVITIGDNVKITILGVAGDQVRMGFAAPEDVPIHRLEVFERIKESSATGLIAKIKNFVNQ